MEETWCKKVIEYNNLQVYTCTTIAIFNIVSIVCNWLACVLAARSCWSNSRSKQVSHVSKKQHRLL